MRLKLIHCQVLTREIEAVLARSAHSIDLEPVAMGQHALGSAMTSGLQARIDASDPLGYDAILLGYALCGRGTEGLRAGRTQLVLPRAHDCIGLLMGSRHRYQAYFDAHPGTCYRSPGWIEFRSAGSALQPADSMLPNPDSEHRSPLDERSSLAELIARYGEDNGRYLYKQFSAYRRNYSRLAYISTGVPSDAACRAQARDEAHNEGWAFDEVAGSLSLIERLLNGPWDGSDFLVVPPGAVIRAAFGNSIVGAQ